MQLARKTLNSLLDSSDECTYAMQNPLMEWLRQAGLTSKFHVTHLHSLAHS